MPRVHPDPQALLRTWWETPVIDADEEGYDAEIRAINTLMPEIDAIPDWALALRGAMPKWGMEMCAHRWLDGLDHLLRGIGQESYCLSPEGRCGHLPGQVVAAAEERAAAVEAWLEGRPLSATEERVGEVLGQATESKRQVATCFVELVRASLFGQLERDDWLSLVESWRQRGQDNELLIEILGEYGLHEALDNSCGWKFVDKLDLYIALIGGDRLRERERIYNCNSQLRFIWRDDPARYAVTQGYLWGLYAYLGGHDEAWLREEKPARAGAALYALQALGGAADQEPLKRWLAASLLKTTGLWCQRAIVMSRGAAPEWASDLPAVNEAI